jgi:ABC-type transport system substrate-binding protein
MPAMRRKVAALILATGVVASACGDDDDDGDAAETSTSAAATSTSAAGAVTTAEEGATTTATSGTTVGEVPADADTSAILTVVTSIAPQQYDPVRTTFPCDSDELSLIYDTLIRQNPDGTYAPGLATSWEAVDDTTFEIELQQGVMFQDGTPFDAEAVVAHIERARTATNSTLVEQLKFIESVEAVDDGTVRLTLAQPRVGVVPALLADRAGMVPSPEAVEAGGDTYGATGAVGAGPYAYAEATPGEHVRLERWDGYFDPSHQLLGGFESFGLSQQFQIDRLLSGELNYAALNENVLPDVESAADDGSIDFVVDPSTQFMQFFVNFGVAPFDDILVRQALNHAIDREAMNEALAEGIGSVAWGPLPPTSWAHNPEVEEMYPYDPDTARELLTEAGHPDGLTIPTGVIQIPLYQRTAELLQDMLEDSGITLELIPVTGAEVNNRLYVTKDLTAAVTAFNAPSDPGLALEARYSSTGANNPAGTTADGLDELLAEGAATSDRDERAEAYQAAELLVMEQALEVPIYHFAGLVAFRPEVRNVVMGYTACKGGNFLSPPVYVAQD